MRGQIRQGDILLVPVSVTPPKAATKRKEVVLAVGEATGHAHRIQAPEILEWEVEGQRYIRVIGSAPGALVHEDHDPIPAAVVAPNVTYKVVRQREWDLRDQWRAVTD